MNKVIVKRDILFFVLSVLTGIIILINGNQHSNAASNHNDSLSNHSNKDSVKSNLDFSTLADSLYDSMHLESIGLTEQAFFNALQGWNKLKLQGKVSVDDILTIADFSQPSTHKRLYVIDLNEIKVLYHTYVAHGRNSGKEQAVYYSNRPSSYQSSPGFYKTAGTYYGNNGYSLKLEGLEKGINDNAGRRAIVMHGADYVSESLIKSQGFLGRSQGCPAVPNELARPIINTIKNGSALFIYAPVSLYAEKSDLLN